MRTPAQRFWDKIVMGPDCWLWAASTNDKGYGWFTFEGKTVFAHRFSFELFYGPFDLDLKVLHDCDVPSCVRPDHLFLGTQFDNMRDKTEKGRQAKGSKHGRAKLTDQQVRDIFMSYKSGDFSQQSLANEYGVHQTKISAIVRGVAWNDVTNPLRILQ